MIYPVEGIELAAIKQRIDGQKFCLIVCDNSSYLAAKFTTNLAKAAPVLVAKERLNHQLFTSNQVKKVLLINSGNANAATGKKGLQIAYQSTQLIAKQLAVCDEAVLPFSTGVIGKQLKIDAFIKAQDQLTNNLSSSSAAWQNAAQAILTTDTKEKIISKQLHLEGQKITITGMAKGSGMICPNMATMLAFIATDIAIEAQLLSNIFNEIINKSFNRITVDSDTSTNDAVVLISTNKKKIIKRNSLIKFKKTLSEVCLALAQLIVKDGEGVTKFITIKIKKAASKNLALKIAYDIAHSPLVKTAFFGEDANWGRILAAIGKPYLAGKQTKKIDFNQIELYLDKELIFAKGSVSAKLNQQNLSAIMKKQAIDIKLILNNGRQKTKIYTNDLSYEYIRINAEYHS